MLREPSPQQYQFETITLANSSPKTIWSAKSTPLSTLNLSAMPWPTSTALITAGPPSTRTA
ncbi:Uncharacterised protein [Salmonella enterica subsp. houtenae]|nr:Uncharacterised protein [Salmonella enterica subsp. houtenae]